MFYLNTIQTRKYWKLFLTQSPSCSCYPQPCSKLAFVCPACLCVTYLHTHTSIDCNRFHQQPILRTCLLVVLTAYCLSPDVKKCTGLSISGAPACNLSQNLRILMTLSQNPHEVSILDGCKPKGIPWYPWTLRQSTTQPRLLLSITSLHTNRDDDKNTHFALTILRTRQNSNLVSPIVRHLMEFLLERLQPVQQRCNSTHNMQFL